LKDAHLGAHGLENTLPVADRLARAEPQIAARPQREWGGEPRITFFCESARRYDEQVAA